MIVPAPGSSLAGNTSIILKTGTSLFLYLMISSKNTTLVQHPRNTSPVANGTVHKPIACISALEFARVSLLWPLRMVARRVGVSK